jgi:predicted membrane-bound spermidine synthase
MLPALVFCSGCCALVYQIGWLRELRLVFGASTYASSAVLAIFMGGLGLGSAVLGSRADRHPRPLQLYAWLELGIAAGALASPLLFVLVRKAYVAAGGTPVMGQVPALALRLVLSSLVLGLPTFLMGGTVPAVVRAAAPEGDTRRRAVALLYGFNTLGAVCGAVAATFFLLERLGTRLTVLSGASLNVAVALAAFLAASRTQSVAETEVPAGSEPEAAQAGERVLPQPFVLAAAALTGFVFFLMEIVWYRMLAPILGGTTYTFGIVLAVALAGIGFGGFLFSLLARFLRPTAGLFAATCGLEAFGVALAFGLGDRVAILASTLRPAEAGLAALAGGWTLVAALVVLPAALVAGYQFPLLISLLGRGRADVGRHTGAVYAWNTAGSILGALAGGFGMLPLLGAPDSWRLAAALLVAASAAGAAVSLRAGERQRAALAAAAVATACSLALVTARGPSAVWRHSAIGVGGVLLGSLNRNEIENWIHQARFSVLWEKEGIESSVGMVRMDGLAFVVNGKIDGNARQDAGTQVMGPLVGAILHPAPRKAMVVGLGTGSSAGWLAAIESIDRVDVAELEPAVLEVARQCAPVNLRVLDNPKVHVTIADGRELLMTSRERYDLIFSEPSNPYRAGIAGLYTLEFYRAVANRLAPGGIFSQWVQGYSVDPLTVRHIAATLAAVFGNVETWETLPGDLLFVCSAGPKDFSLPRLAARVATEPFRSALLAAWGVTGVEGFLAGFFSDDTFARHALHLAQQGEGLNTDDLAPVEFGFARSLGSNLMSMEVFRQDTRSRGAHRPAVSDGAVAWERVDDHQLLRRVWMGSGWQSRGGSAAAAAYQGFQENRCDLVRQTIDGGSWQPAAPLERVMAAHCFAVAGDSRALALLPEIDKIWPAAAATIRARLSLTQGAGEAQALDTLATAFAGLRADPWSPIFMVKAAMEMGLQIAEKRPELAERVFELLDQPFSVRLQDQARLSMLMNLAMDIDYRHAAKVFPQFEPNVPWNRPFLEYRLACYKATGNPLEAQARRDLDRYLASETKP